MVYGRIMSRSNSCKRVRILPSYYPYIIRLLRHQQCVKRVDTCMLPPDVLLARAFANFLGLDTENNKIKSKKAISTVLILCRNAYADKVKSVLLSSLHNELPNRIKKPYCRTNRFYTPPRKLNMIPYILLRHVGHVLARRLFNCLVLINRPQVKPYTYLVFHHIA